MDETVVEARSALLDFYSSRAVAHASYFVASIFGIVGLMAVLQGIGKNTELYYLAIIAWFIVYIGFAYIGHWTLRQFGEYASYAETLRKILKEDAKIEENKTSIEDKKNLKRYIEELDKKGQKDRAEKLRNELPEPVQEISMRDYDGIFAMKQRTFMKTHILFGRRIMIAYVVIVLIIALLACYQIFGGKQV